jgi:hypothetical protein
MRLLIFFLYLLFLCFFLFEIIMSVHLFDLCCTWFRFLVSPVCFLSSSSDVAFFLLRGPNLLLVLVWEFTSVLALECLFVQLTLVTVIMQQNTVRISTPDIIPPTASRPPTTHSVQSRTVMSASPTLAPMPMPSIISPTTTALPLNTSLAPSLALDTSDTAPAVRAPLVPSTTSMPPSHGAPLLQPFPPPNPPLSLAPAMQHSGPITKDGVRDALSRLVKVNPFF